MNPLKHFKKQNKTIKTLTEYIPNWHHAPYLQYCNEMQTIIIEQLINLKDM
jgi:hypothetical protein